MSKTGPLIKIIITRTETTTTTIISSFNREKILIILLNFSENRKKIYTVSFASLTSEFKENLYVIFPGT